MLCQCCEGIQREKEKVLQDNRRVGKCIRSRAIVRFLNSCPCQVDVKEHKEGAQTKNGGVECVICTAEPVEEKVSIYLGTLLLATASYLALEFETVLGA